MKTQKCTQGWKSYSTNSFLLLTLIIVLFILKVVFAIERQNDGIRNFLERNVVVTINDEVVIDKKLITDTLNIYMNHQQVDVVDSTKQDTLILDTLSK